VASRIPNRRARAVRDDAVPEAEMSEEQALESDELPTEEAEGNLPVTVNGQQVAAAASIAAARRPLVENLPRWIPKYIRDSILELSKVTWPTNKEALKMTTIVVIFAIIFAAAFFAVDLGLTSLLQAFISKINP
jgi:preprotein translocase SecE subunit